MKREISSLDELKLFAKDFLNSLEKKDIATIVALHGDLGRGKTTFVQNIASVLSISDNPTSPTFVIMKNYEIPEVGREDNFFRNLIHIDAYRLDSGADLEKLNWNFYKNNPDNLIFIEWAEKVSDILSENIIHIYFEIKEGEKREVEIMIK